MVSAGTSNTNLKDDPKDTAMKDEMNNLARTTPTPTKREISSCDIS